MRGTPINYQWNWERVYFLVLFNLLIGEGEEGNRLFKSQVDFAHDGLMHGAAPEEIFVCCCGFDTPVQPLELMQISQAQLSSSACSVGARLSALPKDKHLHSLIDTHHLI